MTFWTVLYIVLLVLLYIGGCAARARPTNPELPPKRRTQRPYWLVPRPDGGCPLPHHARHLPNGRRFCPRCGEKIDSPT